MDEIGLDRLHRRLKRALTAKNISQRELGRRIGATQASVSHYVNGRQLPGATTQSGYWNAGPMKQFVDGYKSEEDAMAVLIDEAQEVLWGD